MSDNGDSTILVLDDDEIILIALQETLRTADYEVTTTSSAHEAIELLKEKPYAVIISDQRMAEMTGLEFFQEAKRIRPEASRILITGVLTLKTVIDAINNGEIYRFLAKPWLREELLATVRNAVQRHQLIKVNSKLQEDTLRLNEQLAEANSELKQKIRELRTQKDAVTEAHEALERNFDHSLELCYRIITAHYPLLGKETRAIVDLCEQLIEQGSFSESEARTLRVAAWLQNIGLIGVSRDLVLKAREDPDSLTDEEAETIRNHPAYGQTLAAFVDNLQDTGATIRAHHERWDGSGYPDGLAGETIPRPARYLGVVVFFVESGLSREAALEQVLQGSGHAFDPEAVRLFLKATRMAKLPRKVREVTMADLEPGMTLAQGLYSPTGLLLIPEGKALTAASLDKIRHHNLVDPLTGRLLVYS